MLRKEQEKKLQDLEAKVKKIKESLIKETKETFSEVSEELFNKYKWLEEISWAQYTPYFNDGDSCEFRVNEFNINGCTISYSGKEIFPKSFYSLKFSEEELEEFTDLISNSPEKLKEFNEVYDSVRQIMEYITEDIALELFGDHVLVSIQRSGTFVEEYEHD